MGTRLGAMPVRFRRQDLGKHQADRSIRQLAEELRTARLTAGLSLRDVADSSGLSASQVCRLEHGRSPATSLRTLSIVFAVLGMRLSARPFPEGSPIRDAAHARLLTRFKADLPPTVKLRTEVPLRYVQDLRAWDGELEAHDGTCKLEAETVLYDIQAQERRIALKMADDHVDRVILLVADTHRNRRVLREFRELIAARFPLDTRVVMRQLRAGGLPQDSGVVLR
jgi:transcriptional regulator with XRE-family HTH domain